MSCDSLLDEEDEIMYHIDQINPTLKDEYLKNKQIFGFNSENLYAEIEELIAHLESYEATLAQLKIIFTDYYNSSQKKINVIKSLEEKLADLLHKNNIYRIVNDDLKNSLESEEQKNKILSEHLHEKELEVSKFEKLSQLKCQSLSNSNSDLLKNSNNKSDEIMGHPRNKSQQMLNFHQSPKKQKKIEHMPIIRRLTFDLDTLKFQNKNFEDKIKRLSEDYENLHLEYDRTVSIKEKIVTAYNKKEKDLEFMQKEILNLQNELDHYKKICIYQNNMLTEGINYQKCNKCKKKEYRDYHSLTSIKDQEKSQGRKMSNRLLLFDKLEEISNINLKNELNSRLVTVFNSENFEKMNRISQISMNKGISNTFLKGNSQLNLEENNDTQLNLRKDINLNFQLHENFEYEPLKKHLSCLSINENEISKEEEEEENNSSSDLSMRIPNPNSKRSFEELHGEV